MSRHQAVVPPSSYRVFGLGQVCLDARPGSLVLVRSPGVIGAGIRSFERLRVGADYAWCNHACITLTGGPNAVVAQATAKGIVCTALAELGAETYAVVDITMTPAQRLAVVEFARWSVGCGYGWLQIPADAFNNVTGVELSLGIGMRMVCSTAACRALERSDFIPGRSPGATTPGRLAQWFDVRLPTQAPVKLTVASGRPYSVVSSSLR